MSLSLKKDIYSIENLGSTELIFFSLYQNNLQQRKISDVLGEIKHTGSAPWNDLMATVTVLKRVDELKQIDFVRRALQ